MNFLFLFFSLSVFVNVEGIGQRRDQFVPIGEGFGQILADADKRSDTKTKPKPRTRTQTRRWITLKRWARLHTRIRIRTRVFDELWFQAVILFPWQESRDCGYETVKGLRKKGWFDNRDSGSEWEDSFFLKQIRLVLKQKLKDFFKTSPQKRLASRFQKKWTSQRTGISSTWPFLRCSGNEKICGYKKVNIW